jgi:hypothetical protein
MKVIKYLFSTILVASLFAIVFVYAFTENEGIFKLEGRKIIINKPQHEVFNYLVHIDNKKYWLSDSSKKIERNSVGKDGTVGFYRTWKIETPFEEGKETLVEIKNNESVTTFIENNMGNEVAKTKQILICKAFDLQKTQVIWQLHIIRPLNFITRLSFGFVKLLGNKEADNIVQQKFNETMNGSEFVNSLDNSLARLKNNVEKN